MTRPFVVLAIDDVEADLQLLSLAFRKAAPDVITRFVQGGEEGVAYMLGEGKYADRNTFPLPKVILLDLKMPRVDGFDVLKRVRSMPWGSSPYIVILSSSNLQEDINKADSLGADIFHTKPIDFHSLCEMIGRIEGFFRLAPLRESRFKF